MQGQLGIGSYKTPWLLLHKLRRAMVDPGRSLLQTLVEIDETEMPLRSKNDPADRKKGGRSPVGKIFIVGAVNHCGIAPRSAACRPRIHDLRHSFAVSTIVDDYRSSDPGSRLAILSTYLGHADPDDTYWYLSAAPELLGLAGEMLERNLRGGA